MSIYRGAGGTTDTTDQATVDEVTTLAAQAASSASSASSSASSASTSASTATTQATNAATSATNAASSATTASQSKDAAVTAKTAAETAQAAAEAAETAAESAKDTAVTYGNTAYSSSQAAIAAQVSAETARDVAKGYRDTAITKADEAAASATAAAIEASEAASTVSTYATAASNSADAAAASALEAAEYANNAEAALNAMQGVYVGSHASAPTTDGNGNAITTGDWYYNTTDTQAYIWNGTSWDALAPDLVGDTTPQLGGDLSTNGNDVLFGDGDKAIFGSGVTNVELYSVGYTNNLDVNGSLVFLNNGASMASIEGGVMQFDDNKKLQFGGSGDLQIYHDGSNSYVTDAGTGDLLLITGGNAIRMQSGAGENMLVAVPNSNTKLFYDNSEKLSTTSTGIDVTGTATMDGLTVDGTADTSINRVDGSTYSSTTPSADLILSRKNTENTSGQVVGIRFDVTGWNGTTTGGAAIDAVQADGNLSSADLVFTTRNNGTYGERLRLSNDGDISFYEDTGTTPKLVWKAADERLGIGTSSPSAKLGVAGGVAVGRAFGAFPSSGTNLELVFDSSTEKAYIQAYDRDTSSWEDLRLSGKSIEFRTNGTATTTFDSSGNVGIGTSSPTGGLFVATQNNTSYSTEVGVSLGASASTGAVEVFGTSTGASLIDFSPTDGVTDFGGRIFYSHGTEHMAFSTNATEAMRIDSSGNLLVGKTSASYTIAGAQIESNGVIGATSSIQPMFANRLTSDGSIFGFYKDGSAVGSIGNSSTNLTIGSSDVGISFGGGADAITPWNTSTGTDRDAAIDLGTVAGSTRRFRNLYLSGGVYLGGTGAANHLDDYEDGNYAATATPDTSGTVTLSSTFDTLSYTKIGKLVTVTGVLQVSAVSSPVGNVLEINLPFVTANSTDGAGRTGGAVYFSDGGVHTTLPYITLENASVARIYVDCSTLAANDNLHISIAYRAA
jgi:hypothetical protein